MATASSSGNPDSKSASALRAVMDNTPILGNIRVAAEQREVDAKRRKQQQDDTEAQSASGKSPSEDSKPAVKIEFKKGGKIDGIAQRGKTRGRVI